MDSITDEAYFRAIDAVKKCINKNGLYASGGISGYNSIWSRDSMITLLGASLVKDKEIKEAYKKSLNYLAKFQNDLGEIPNCIDIFDKVRPKQVTFATIDSSLWFIIGEYVYALNYKDKSLLNKHKKNIEKALKQPTAIRYYSFNKDVKFYYLHFKESLPKGIYWFQLNI